MLTLCLSSLPVHEIYTDTQHRTQCQSVNIWSVHNISKLFDPVVCWHCVYHPSLCTRYTPIHNTDHNVSLWIYDQFIIFLNCLSRCVLTLCLSSLPVHEICTETQHRTQCQPVNIWSVHNIYKLFDPVACWHCVYHPYLWTQFVFLRNTEHSVSELTSVNPSQQT